MRSSGSCQPIPRGSDVAVGTLLINPLVLPTSWRCVFIQQTYFVYIRKRVKGWERIADHGI